MEKMVVLGNSYDDILSNNETIEKNNNIDNNEEQMKEELKSELFGDSDEKENYFF